jgi:DNA-directed RNA polymerase specialized sigma24 family protein
MAREPDWGDLRRRLVTTARKRGMPVRDVDDVVQDAILKILKRGSWTNENLERYLYRALRDKEAEHWRRKKSREPQVLPADDGQHPHDPLERWSPPSRESSLDFMLTESAVRQVLDADAMAYAVLHAMGFTGRQIARQLGWTQKKVEAARIRLARKKRAVALAVLGHIPEHIKGEVQDVD